MFAAIRWVVPGVALVIALCDCSSSRGSAAGGAPKGGSANGKPRGGAGASAAGGASGIGAGAAGSSNRGAAGTMQAGASGSASGASGGAGGAGATGSVDPGGPTAMTGQAPKTSKGDLVGDFQYYEVDGAVCRDGSPAGYYLRQGKSPNLMIFLNGGGVCFDDFFCGINPANVDQSLPGETLFGATLDQISSALVPVRQTPPAEGIFFQDPTNPVADWSMVFVPYCTGDVYAGTTRDSPVTTSTTLPNQQFVGYTNLGLFYQTLADTIGPGVSDSKKVLLTGSSAGGFGTLLNFDRTQAFFKNSIVYAVTDSGIPFRDQYLEPCIQKKWRELWGLDKILPKDCKGCFNPDGGGLAEGLGSYIFKEKYKGRMLGGGVSSTQDQIIKLFFSAGLNNCSTDTTTEAVAAFLGAGSYPPDRYPAGLQDFIDNVAGSSAVGAYLIDSDLHQHLFRSRFYEDNGVGKTIAIWLGDLLNDQPERLGVSGTSSTANPPSGGAGSGP